MASLHELIGELRYRFLHELKGISDSKGLESLKVRYLGKKGPIQALMLELKAADADERPHLGKLINDLKQELSAHCDHSFQRLQAEEQNARLSSESIDPTLPGRRESLGRVHLIQQMLQKMLDVLIGMGFSVRTGPDVDTDYHNFGALNFAEDHPARDMQDTFYLEDGRLLRTHTSNVQSRIMQEFAPPLRIASPGRAFRNEDVSSRSHIFFHQVEAFYIDKHVTFADFLSTMDEFVSKLLGEKVETRFRPSYFPFVEPGMEVDVRCTACRGSGCRLCKHTGWLEICGSGMIHPKVLQKGNIDPEVYSGFAWGMGIERLAILHYDIPDIRMFTENDLRFLGQFP